MSLLAQCQFTKGPNMDSRQQFFAQFNIVPRQKRQRFDATWPFEIPAQPEIHNVIAMSPATAFTDYTYGGAGTPGVIQYLVVAAAGRLWPAYRIQGHKGRGWNVVCQLHSYRSVVAP